MLYLSIRKIPFIRANFKSIFSKWGEKKCQVFISHLKHGERVLDLGCGSGLLTHILRKKGFDVTPVDVENSTLLADVNPLIYDGERIPFAANSFDCVSLITVLHHCPMPEKVLAEALRVGKKVIIVEDTYTNILQRSVTLFLDTLVNYGTSSLPFKNKQHKEWLATIEDLGAQVIFEKQKRQVLILKQSIFVIRSLPNEA